MQSLSWLEVDLEAVRSNLAAVSSTFGAPVYCVVKADAYGHGASVVAAELAKLPQCRGLVVARWEEALTLGGLAGKPILCLGSFLGAREASERLEMIEAAREMGVEIVIGSIADVDALTETLGHRHAGDTGAWWPLIHVAVDTGMTREGLAVSEVAQAVERLLRCPATVRSVFSHFAESEVAHSPVTNFQQRTFAAVQGLIDGCEKDPVILHIANSAASLSSDRKPFSPDSDFEFTARVGGALYGLDLRADGEPSLTPAMSVRTRLVQVREVASGTPVGYGGRWVATRPSVLGLVPLGYADGLMPRPAELCWVDADGVSRRVPVVGTVSMDSSVVDLTDAVALGCPAMPGQEVVALGRSSHQTEVCGPVILAEQHAALNGVSPYAVTVAFSRRLQRRFLNRTSG